MYSQQRVMYRCAGGHIDIVRLLIDNHAGVIHDKSDNGDTPFMYACKGAHIDIVRLLIDNHACVFDDKD